MRNALMTQYELYVRVVVMGWSYFAPYIAILKCLIIALNVIRSIIVRQVANISDGKRGFQSRSSQSSDVGKCRTFTHMPRAS
jgi:hypothetical protein